MNFRSLAPALALIAVCVVHAGAAEPAEKPAVDVHSFDADGQTVLWDFTLHAHAGNLPPEAAGTGLVEFADAANAENRIAVALAEAKLAPDGARASLTGRTTIDNKFGEGCYVTTLRYRVGEGAEERARLGVLVVKHRRQFISFIPHNKKSGAYPPEILAWTEEVKQAQRGAGTKLMKDMNDAVKAGAKEFVIPKGHYRLTLPPHKGGGKPAYFTWENLDGFTLDGQGSTVWLDTIGANGIRFATCKNTTIRNLTFDYDPLPFSQGRVVAIDEEKKRLRFACEEGFEDALKQFFEDKGLLRIHAFHDEIEKGRLLKKEWIAGHTGSTPIVPLGDGLYETGLVVRYWPPKKSGLEVGDAVAFCPRWGGAALVMFACDGMRFENVTIYASGLDGVVDSYSGSVGGKGSLYSAVQLRRRPNTRRLVCANSSGIFMMQMGPGLSITDSIFEGTMDDSVAVQTFNPLVVKSLSETEHVIANRHASVPMFIKAGATVGIYDLETLAPRGSAKIETMEPYTEEGLAEKEAARNRFSWQPSKFYKVKLSKPLALEPMDMVLWEERPAAVDFKIENCFFYTGWARSLYVTGERGVIRENTFEATGRINIGPSTAWLIGTFAKDIVIEKNRLTDIRGDDVVPLDAVPIRAGYDSATKSPHALNSKITIRDNTIERCAYSGIAVEGTDGVTITGNILKRTNLNRCEVPKNGVDLNKPITVSACRNVIEKNNTAHE